MRSVLVSAALLGVMTVTVPSAAAAPLIRTSTGGEGADGGQGAILVRAGTSSFLSPPATRQSAIVAVGEGGEGGKGRKRRQRGYGYAEPWRYRGNPYPPDHWAPAPRGYYQAPPPSPYGGQPEPGPRYRPPQPGYGRGWIDPER